MCVVVVAMQHMSMWASVCEINFHLWNIPHSSRGKHRMSFSNGRSVDWLNWFADIVINYLEDESTSDFAGCSNAVNEFCSKHNGVDIGMMVAVIVGLPFFHHLFDHTLL